MIGAALLGALAGAGVTWLRMQGAVRARWGDGFAYGYRLGAARQRDCMVREMDRAVAFVPMLLDPEDDDLSLYGVGSAFQPPPENQHHGSNPAGAA